MIPLPDESVETICVSGLGNFVRRSRKRLREASMKSFDRAKRASIKYHSVGKSCNCESWLASKLKSSLLSAIPAGTVVSSARIPASSNEDSSKTSA